MPPSKVNLRVTRSTSASRSKVVRNKKVPHKHPGKANHAPSPGWVSGHADLFQVPLSPRRPNTRRSSMYQKVSSPSRYKNAKIPGFNCRHVRQAKNSTYTSPSHQGVMTRSRRSSMFLANATPLFLTPMSPKPASENVQPLRSGSKKSVKGSTSSKTSKLSKTTISSSKTTISSKVSLSSDKSQNNLVFREPVNVLSTYTFAGDHMGEIPVEETLEETVSGSTTQSNPSAVPMSSLLTSSTSSTKSLTVVSKMSETRSESTDSLFPQKSAVTSLTMEPAEEFIFPSMSDTEISFNASRNELPPTPRSKRFLEAVEASPAPVATRSFHPPSSAKKLKLSYPTTTISEKLVTRYEKRADLDNNVSSDLSDSFCIIPKSTSQTTPSRSLREMSLRDISNCSSRLDSSTRLDTFQTPVAQKSLLDTESIFETPQHSFEEEENSENVSKGNDSVEAVDLTQPSSSSRCVIL
ncbi:uncharacterized protein LOC135468321 isoform X2 [Liolophura sinensis]